MNTYYRQEPIMSTERCPDCGGWFVGECTHGLEPDTHVILVAIQVTADTREAAHEFVQSILPPAGEDHVEAWWIAEDDRSDGSDNDSAVFCHPGAAGVAYATLRRAGLTADYNAPVRVTGQFVGGWPA